eukprot:6112589-Prymnesium_polylepis.1
MARASSRFCAPRVSPTGLVSYNDYDKNSTITQNPTCSQVGVCRDRLPGRRRSGRAPQGPKSVNWDADKPKHD